MKPPLSWAAVRPAVDAALEALDDRPRIATWRTRAVGAPRSEVVAALPRQVRIDLRVDIDEMRVLRELADKRGMSVRGYVRSAVATIAVGLDDVDPDELPQMTRLGPILP